MKIDIDIKIILLIFLFIILYPLKEGLGPTNFLKPVDGANIGDSLLRNIDGSASNAARTCEDVHLVNNLNVNLSERCLNSFYLHLSDTNPDEQGYYPCIYNIESGTCRSQMNLLDELNSELRYLQENPVTLIRQIPQINCDGLSGNVAIMCERRNQRRIEVTSPGGIEYIDPEIIRQNKIEYENYLDRVSSLEEQISQLQSQNVEDRGPKCNNSPVFDTPLSDQTVLSWVDGDSNVISQCDILCGVSEPEDVHGDRQIPCTNLCSSITCGTGYIDKPNVRLSWGTTPTTDLCCDRVTCDDIICESGYSKKQSPSLSPGVLPTNELCCDQTCENIICESDKGYKNKQSPSFEAGVVPTINECCEKKGECINDNDCSENFFQTNCSDWECVTSTGWWVLLIILIIIIIVSVVISATTRTSSNSSQP